MPKNAYNVNGDRFYYLNNDAYVSVTTVLDREPKPGLEKWKKRRIIEEYRAHVAELEGLTPAKALDYIERLDESSRSSQIGNIVHAYLETGERPDELSEDVIPFLDRIDEFIREYRPRVLFTERTVYSTLHGYAGTSDIVFEIGGKRYFGDLKTGKSVWPEVGMQLAAYANADFMHLDNDVRLPISEIGASTENGIVLHVRPDRAPEPRFVKIDGRVYNTFLSLLDVFYWGNGESENVIGGIVPIYE